MSTSITSPSNPISITTWHNLPDRKPTYALAANVDLVIIRYDDTVSVLYGRCLHRGALMADGHVQRDDYGGVMSL